MSYPLRPLQRGDSPASIRYHRRKRNEFVACCLLGLVIVAITFLIV